LLAAVPAFADPSIGSKRAEAQQVMGQVQQLGTQLETAIAQYQYATIRLKRIQHNLRENRFELTIARTNLHRSQVIIAKRLVTLYRDGDSDSTIEVILGAKSLDDMMNRLDTAKSVTKLDTAVLKNVEASRNAVAATGRRLAHEHAMQKHVVAQRAATKRDIESKIAEQRRLLASIKNQIAQMEAAERARQLQIARAAQARLVQQREQQRQAQDNTVVGASATVVSASTTAPASSSSSTSSPPSPSSTVSTSSTVVAPPSKYTGVVGYAMQELGTPYVWGGAAPGGFDCSGLVMWAYAQVGVSLPHSSYAMWGYGVSVSVDQLQPGDIVFFDGLGHVGLYIGGGQFIEAPHTGAFVQISSLAGRMGSYVGARRIL
jgi:cell wall-associated NlpC family hydrolase